MLGELACPFLPCSSSPGMKYLELVENIGVLSVGMDLYAVMSSNWGARRISTS
jgi:hypothetical protein